MTDVANSSVPSPNNTLPDNELSDNRLSNEASNEEIMTQSTDRLDVNLQQNVQQSDNVQEAQQSKMQQISHKLIRAVKTLGQYVVIFIVIHLLVSWWRQPSMPTDVNLQLTDYQNQTIDLQQMSQQSPVLIYFWGSWCGACSVSSPKVNQLAMAGYPVVSIAVKSGDAETLDNYLTNHNYQFTTINDVQGHIFRSWQGKVTPSYVILDKGEMSQGMTGVQPLWVLKLRLWVSRYF